MFLNIILLMDFLKIVYVHSNNLLIPIHTTLFKKKLKINTITPQTKKAKWNNTQKKKIILWSKKSTQTTTPPEKTKTKTPNVESILFWLAIPKQKLCHWLIYILNALSLEKLIFPLSEDMNDSSVINLYTSG